MVEKLGQLELKNEFELGGRVAVRPGDRLLERIGAGGAGVAAPQKTKLGFIFFSGG